MENKNKFISPFYRPWMITYGAAAPAGGSNKGMKGIVAGKILPKYYQLILPFMLYLSITYSLK
jgi:hypothetical protein